jgi:transcriptional regulator NrdR family protein
MIKFLKKNNNKSITCPECKGRMEIIAIDSGSLPDYYEIRRKYKCRKCRHEYSSIELIAINGDIQSVADDLNKLYSSIDTLNASLKTLLEAAHKLHKVKGSGVYKGPVMN